MGLFDRLWPKVPDPKAIEAVSQTARFATIEPDSVESVLAFGTTTNYIYPAQKISRREAIEVPAVKRSRDIIAGTLGQLPLYVQDREFNRTESDFLEQPEAGVPRSVTMVRTFEDLLFESVAYWEVTKRFWHGYPAEIKRHDPSTVNVNNGVIRIGNRVVPASDMIQFQSPNDALLVAGARAIRTALRLDAAASRYADEPMPSGMFTPVDGIDPEQEEIDGALDAWGAARRTRGTAYVPAALNYQTLQWSPEQLQLADARQHAVLEISRLTGIDAEDLGVSTTSRTYFNSVDRRQTLQDYVLAPYATAVADRLSMGDVTPRGYEVRFDFGAFIKSDESTRMDTYAKAVALGAYGVDEVQRREELPAFKKKETPVAQPQPQPQQIEQAKPAALNFSADAERLSLTFDVSETFKVDAHARTITGMAVPYGQVANKDGRKFRFNKGSLKYSDLKRVKLLRDHQATQAIGVAIKATETPQGMVATFKVARGPEGDAALSLAEDGVLDGLSVGVDFNADGVLMDDEGVIDVLSAAWRETSLTALPAFDTARVSSVHASSDQKDSITMPDTIEQKAPEGVDFSALTNAIKDGFAGLTVPATTTVPVADTTKFVAEPVPYRFNGTRGQYDFSTDLFAHLREGDGEAGSRLTSFMNVAFANTATTDVNELAPNGQRPDLYVDQMEYRYPVWEAINKGTLSEITPFVFPKFNTSSGLVGDHTEGTEPTEGSFTTTSATVTPTALSGKAILNREVFDQGGNPQVSGLIWRQMVRGWYEALEAKAVAVLVAAAGSITDIALTAGAADDALEGEITAALASLQYIRGGNTMTDFFVQIDLYKKLVAAVDGNGRKLFPVLGAQNATGTAAANFGSVGIGSLVARPAWALAATGAVVANSWLFDRDAVSGWASAPQRFDFSYKVASVEIGVWGYVATVVNDVNKVRQVTYDPVA